MNDATRYAQRCLDTAGYVVMRWCDGPLPIPKVGDIIREDVGTGVPDVPGRVLGPFRIIAEASREDYLAQLKFLGRKPLPEPRETLAYFKVIAE